MIDLRMKGSRHKLQYEIGSFSFGWSSESSEAQAQQAIPAPGKAAAMRHFPMTGAMTGETQGR